VTVTSEVTVTFILSLKVLIVAAILFNLYLMNTVMGEFTRVFRHFGQKHSLSLANHTEA
jgi:hypothetical protein